IFSANLTAAPPAVDKNLLLAPESRIDPASKGPALISVRPEHRDFSVVLVCVFGILMALASIMIVIGFTYKRIQVDRERRRRQRGAPADFPVPHNDPVVPSWPSGDEHNSQQATAMPVSV
ncbi:unnamed protein product, partial [Strongylus vulgaris]